MPRDEDDDSRPEPKRKFYRCGDRTCGALDCPSCYPFTYEHATSDEEAALGNETEETEE